MSQKSIEASRRNGAKSRGPVTPEGKRNSSRNAMRHGLLSETVVMPSESEAAFRQFLTEMTDIYLPQNVAERGYVEAMAVARWRIERAWALEKATFVKEESRQLQANPDLACEEGPSRTADALRTLADQSHALDVIGRYETRLERHFDRALSRLNKAREKADRPAIENGPRENA